MALKTVSELKDSVAGILSGLDLNNVANLNGALERGTRTLVQKADVPEASGIQNITLYSGVYNYACDERIFGTAINDIRPQGISRTLWDSTVKTNQEDFDRTKKYYTGGTQATFQYENGQPIIRIKAPFPKQAVLVDRMNEVGNWVASGNLTGLTQNNNTFYEAPSSLRFTLTGASTGEITETLTNSLDLSSYEGVGVAFLAIRLPNTDLTSITLRLGSDSTNYSYVTATQGFLGQWISDDWALIAFDFSTGTDFNSPDWANIDYVQVMFDTTGTLTNANVGGLFISQPAPAQILYQSAAIYLPDGSQTALNTITANTDQIILNDAAYTLLEYEGALAILQQTGGGDGDSMTIRIQNELKGLYEMYRGDNPSQELRLLGSYYPNDRFGGRNGR